MYLSSIVMGLFGKVEIGCLAVSYVSIRVGKGILSSPIKFRRCWMNSENGVNEFIL